MRKVVVTGGGGFIGSHVAEHFHRKGDRVVVIDNLSRAEWMGARVDHGRYNWEYLRTRYPDIELVLADVRDPEQIGPWLGGAEVIIHCAGQTAVTTSLLNPRADFECNAGGTVNILECARELCDRPTVLFCSTNKVYGANVNRIDIVKEAGRYAFSDPRYRNGVDESFSVDHCVHTPYGCSKLTADIYMQDYSKYYGLKTGVFRMSCIYGTRQFGMEDQGWIAHFVISALLGRPIKIYGDGYQVRDVLHVSDLVRAFDLFVNSELESGVFNMGGGVQNVMSLKELVSYLESSLDRKLKISYEDWRPADQKVYVSDTSAAEAALGWTARVSPEKGVSELINWARENRELL